MDLAGFCQRYDLFRWNKPDAQQSSQENHDLTLHYIFDQKTPLPYENFEIRKSGCNTLANQSEILPNNYSIYLYMLHLYNNPQRLRLKIFPESRILNIFPESSACPAKNYPKKCVK